MEGGGEGASQSRKGEILWSHHDSALVVPATMEEEARDILVMAPAVAATTHLCHTPPATATTFYAWSTTTEGRKIRRGNGLRIIITTIIA